MARKLKFYLLGLIPGLLLMFFIFNMKGAKCSGYLPNSRVIAETLSKKFSYSPQVDSQMKFLGWNEKFLRDSIIAPGKIDFEKSNAQLKPCPRYHMLSPEKAPKFTLDFEKCEDGVQLLTLEKLP